MQIDKFIGRTLNKNEALIAESILGQKDIDYLDDVHTADDPEEMISSLLLKKVRK